MDSSLAVINAGVSSAEDSPFVSSTYRFLPGDYIYVTFEIAGFKVLSTNRNETKSISLAFEVTPQDDAGKPLDASDSGEIKTELAPEDKTWVPKRRASFLLPSFLAAGPFRVHIAVKDLIAKAETSCDVTFFVGGTKLQPASSITVENFHFFRTENETEPLSVAAYSPGDTVYAHFVMTGFANGGENRHRISYSVHVFAPNGKTYLDSPQAAQLDAASFYPAQFVPGDIAVKTSKDSLHGSYLLILTVRDLVSNQQSDFKQTFSLE